MTWIIRALNLTAVLAASLALIAWLGPDPNHNGTIVGACIAILCILAATTLAWRQGTRST